MKLFSTIACGLLAASIAAVPASAAVIGLGGSSSSTDGSDGNVRSFSVGGINVQATAFSFDTVTSTTVRTAWLGQYGTSGLGVTNTNESDGGDGTHAVDNSGRIDFVLFVFDRNVNISHAVLNPFSSGGSNDNDAWVGWGTVANAYNATTPVTLATTNSIFATLSAATNGKNVTGNMGTGHLTNFNTGGNAGNVWMISAARSNRADWDHTIDGFKLGSITVTQVNGVPEPATWAMMIVGFGTVGAAMRRRRRVVADLTATA